LTVFLLVIFHPSILVAAAGTTKTRHLAVTAWMPHLINTFFQLPVVVAGAVEAAEPDSGASGGGDTIESVFVALRILKIKSTTNVIKKILDSGI
jgi:hypothetical protein